MKRRSFQVRRKCGHEERIFVEGYKKIDFNGERTLFCGMCRNKLKEEMRYSAYRRGNNGRRYW